MKGLEGLILTVVQERDLHCGLEGVGIDHLLTCWLTKCTVGADLDQGHVCRCFTTNQSQLSQNSKIDKLLLLDSALLGSDVK